ncbi:hypothetical protein C1645_835141 [Glomus cerebriforme]|uniref:Uncharacterized protein n=1 Tax=Glomus cerebriforme TaxID=658196 RepID=A0A397SCM4_9GLOM|nr:hypothetical protein C1645_835141 [Glomus cerebriforme]
MFIIVQENEGAKIITGPLVKEVEENSLFSTFFDSISSGNYFYQNVRVVVKKIETRSWVPVHEGLEGIWYIDPHLEKLRSRGCHLPLLFSSLPVYQQNNVYDEYYQRMKKKIKLSLAEPWASKDFWQEIVSAVFELTSMMKKYFDHLESTNNHMKTLHGSENPAREPSTNCNLFVPTGLYRYPHGNYLGTLNFIWREPNPEEIYEDYEILKAQMIIRINDIIPIYCTSQMRKNVLQKYSLVRNISKPVLRMLYHDLTGDASLANDQISKEMEERLRLMMLLEDPSIIIDLRINNGSQGSNLNIFWEELMDILMRELRDRINTRLYAKYQGPSLPSDIFIPSEEWIRLNFAPSNAYTTKAMHEDEHYCRALFKYEREFNIKYRDYIYFISADDKHKVPIGEGVAVSTGIRNKKTLAPANGEITAADHDFNKLSLTPSVTLFINIPNEISESFYDGKVYVSFKDAVFQPSSALRHSTEFFNLISCQYYNQPLPSILSLYTDGGPDHRCTFGSVQVALICLFLAGVAIEREKIPEKYEDEFEALKTIEDIREKTKNNPCLFLRKAKAKVKLEKCIETENPASNSEIDEMFEIKKCNQPSCEVCYPVGMPMNIFQNLYFLPDPVPSQGLHLFFANLYGKPTTEKFHPSLINLKSKAELVPNDHSLAQKIFVRIQISCDSPIELLYYTSKKVGNIPICYWCGVNNDFVTVPQNLQCEARAPLRKF